MPQDITRTMGPSSSQSESYNAIGHAEDMRDMLYNIAPTDTPLLSTFGHGPNAEATDIAWMTKGLRPAQKNAHLEKENYSFPSEGSIEGLTNTCQYFQNSGYVTDVEQAVKHSPDFDPMDEARSDALLGQAQDIEYALINNDTKVPGTANVPPLFGGLPYFMNLNTLGATFDHTTGKFTCVKAHNLKTGDFVYLVADAMPTGLVAQRVYYIRQDDTTPDTVFTIYDTQKDAVENIAANIVSATTDGTNVQVCKANVISLGKAADFTLDDINDVMQMAAARGGKPTEAYMAPEKKRHFSQLVTGSQTTMRTADDKSGSDVAESYATDGGTVNAHSHRMYPANRIDILDMQYWDLRFLQPTHEVPNLPKQGTYDTYAVESKLSLQGTQPKASASLIGIKR